MAQPPIEVLCKECFTREDPGGTGRLDRSRFQSALGRVFASLQPLVPQPDGTFDRVYESYAAKCGGNGVSVRAMEDAAKQFATQQGGWPWFTGKVSYHQKKRAESAKQTEAPAVPVRDLPAALPAKQPVLAGSQKKQIIEETSPKAYPLPQQVPFSPPRDLAAAVPSRPGYGKAVELASAVMCPMKQHSSVREDYIMDDSQKLGEGSFGQVCVVTHKVTGQKRACKRVAVQTEMEPGQQSWDFACPGTIIDLEGSGWNPEAMRILHPPSCDPSICTGEAPTSCGWKC